MNNPCLSEKNNAIALAKAQAASYSTHGAKVISLLPKLAQGQAATPNAWVSTPIFAAAEKSGVFYAEKTRMASTKNVEVFYKGSRLTQEHKIILQSLLLMAEKQGTPTQARFATYSLARTLQYTNKKIGGSAYELLKDRIDDMISSLIEVKTPQGRSYSSSLVIRSTRDEQTKEFIVDFDPLLAEFFKIGNYTSWDFNLQIKLRRKPLACWLMDFFSRHDNPRYKVETIHGLSGSEIKELKNFRTAIRRAIKDLIDIGFIWNGGINEDDIVWCKRPDKK